MGISKGLREYIDKFIDGGEAREKGREEVFRVARDALRATVVSFVLANAYEKAREFALLAQEANELLYGRKGE